MLRSGKLAYRPNGSSRLARGDADFFICRRPHSTPVETNSQN